MKHLLCMALVAALSAPGGAAASPTHKRAPLLLSRPLAVGSDFGSGVGKPAPDRRRKVVFGSDLSPLDGAQALINSTIIANGKGLITGPVLNAALLSLVPVFSAMGTFSPSTGAFTMPLSNVPGALPAAGGEMTGILGLVAPAAVDSSSAAISSAWVKQFFPGLTTNVANQNIPGLDGSSSELFINNDIAAVPPTSQSALRFRRNSTFSGGAGSIFVGLNGTCTDGPNVTGGEWCGLFVTNDQGTGSPVALYAQYNRLNANSSGWAATFEGRDQVTADGGTPSKGYIATEIDAFGDGLDTTNQRHALAVFAGHNVGTAPMSAGTGIQIGPQGGCATCQFATGLSIYGAAANAAIDLTGSTGGYAVKIASGAAVSFDGTSGFRQISYNPAGFLQYVIGSNYQFQQFDNAEFRLPSLASDPSAGHAGGTYFNSANGQFRTFNGTAWGNARLVIGTPTSSAMACTPGDQMADASFHYDCVATNTWKRVALSTF